MLDYSWRVFHIGLGTAGVSLDPRRDKRQEQTRVTRDDQQDQQRSKTQGINDAKRPLHCANR